MITAAKRISGSSGESLSYMLGGEEKDQEVRIVAYNGFELSRRMIAEIETTPDNDGIADHKKAVNKIANMLAGVFDARAKLADARVKDAFQRYIISFVSEERERLRRVPTAEELTEYKLPKTETRSWEQIILYELLEMIGVHGNIEVTLRRKGQDEKKIKVTKTAHREAMFLAVAHDGTTHPHLHILAARPDANGKCNDTRNEYRRIHKAIEDLAKKYNLVMKLEDGYEVDRENVNEGYAAKLDMRDKVKGVLSRATSAEEMKSMLLEAGISMSVKEHSDNGKSYGVVFTMLDRKGKRHNYSGGQLDRSLTHARIMKRMAANKARAEKAVCKEMIQGYNSVLPPIGNELTVMMTNAFTLYNDTKKTRVAIGSETTAVFENLKNNWSEFRRLNDERKEAETNANIAAAIGGMLMLLNPLLGLVALLLGLISDDIRMADYQEEMKRILSQIEAERMKIKELKEKKDQLTAEKSERLQNYLNAKQMYNEYREGMAKTDNNIAAIRRNVEKYDRSQLIQSYINSPAAKELLRRINNAFNSFSSYYHLVPGRLVDTDSGLRWELFTDGFTDGHDLYSQHEPAPQEYGKSYIEFGFNERGEVLATVECDNTNYYTKGVSGYFNLSNGSGEVCERQYAGAKEDHDAKPARQEKKKYIRHSYQKRSL